MNVDVLLENGLKHEKEKLEKVKKDIVSVCIAIEEEHRFKTSIKMIQETINNIDTYLKCLNSKQK